MKISPAGALPYFDHPSQRRASMFEGDALPDWCEYYAEGGACLSVHPQFWPGLWQVHIGVIPAKWGRLDGQVNALLRAIWQEKQPLRLVAWVSENNRAALALARRVGFETDGRMPGIAMLGWRI